MCKGTMRYISDRNLPDKTIDAMDEGWLTGSYLEYSCTDTIVKFDWETKRKIKAVKNQQFELAANLRIRRKAIEQAGREQSRWERRPNIVKLLTRKKVAEVLP